MQKPRILIADNIPGALMTYAEAFELAGYPVIQAATLDEAHSALNDGRVHLAILDLRLEDDADEKDKSGLTVASASDETIVKIILTKFPVTEDVRKALKPDFHGRTLAVDFIDKRLQLEELLNAIEQIAIDHVRINWDLPIRWNPPSSFAHLLHLIAPATEQERLADRAAELEDLFRKLFYANEQITIGRVLRQGTGQIDVEVFAYGGGELKGQYAVSCGQREHIRYEKRRYDDLIPRITGVGSTRLEAQNETMRFGIIAYRLMGGELEEMKQLSVFFRRHGSDEIKTMLRHLYNVSLAAWHGRDRFYVKTDSRRALDISWTNHVWSETDASLAEVVSAICQQTLSSGLLRLECSTYSLAFHLTPGTTASLPNPAHLRPEQSLIVEHPVLGGIVHGGIDTSSVLADGSGRTWLIGFGQACKGPLLLDFVHLEDAIKTNLARDVDLPTFHALEQRLLDVSDLHADIPTDGLSSEQKKLAQGVMEIRHLAAEVAGSELAPYFAGLLACALAHVVSFDVAVKHYSSRELIPYVRSLLEAAMLSAKLTAVSLVPAELPEQAEQSLWLDERNRMAWVEGKQIDLTPQDYDLLHYLYQRAGLLCTRQMVLKEGLQDPSQLIHATSRLNSAISRLRQKLEPDPDRPKYITTVRGQGYKLIK